MNFDNLDAILAGVPFFDVCTPDQLHLLAFASERLDLGEGAIVFAKGEQSDGAYVLVEGTAEIRDPELTDDQPGYEISGPGVLLGELGLVMDKPRLNSVVALTPLSLVHVPRPVFAKLMRQYPEVAAAAAERIRQEMGGYIKALNKFKRL